MTQQATGKGMPRYKSHKQVWALKIESVDYHHKGHDCESDGTALMVFTDKDYPSLMMDRAYCNKHRPEKGGYYVLYQDGYTSFSPAEAFESGYTKI